MNKFVFVGCIAASLVMTWTGGYLIGKSETHPTYKSSMGQHDAINGLMKVECHSGDPINSKKFRATAIGINSFGKDVDILVEVNNGNNDTYPSSFWLKDAGLCRIYVTDADD